MKKILRLSMTCLMLMAVSAMQGETVRVYKKATTVESGKAYLIAADVDGTLKVATPITKNYGYINVVDAKEVDGSVELSDNTNDYVITSTEGGYTIKQSDDRYLYQTGTYNSFNVAAEPAEGQVWTIEANSDGTFTITNVSVNKYVQYSIGHTSYGSYASAQDNAVLPTLYVFDSEKEAEVAVPEVDNIEALTALGNGAEATFTLDKCKVSYANGNYVYVRDNTGGMCFFKQEAFAEATNKWQLGGKITGKVSIYNGMTQFAITDASALTHTDGDEYQPVEITIAEAKDHIADLVKITDKITVVADGNKFYSDADKALQIYDNFKIKYSIADGDVFEGLTGVIIPYNKQLEIAPTIDPVTTGIESAKATQAEGAIFNLSGQRVEKAVKGIYIKNGKKFIVK